MTHKKPQCFKCNYDKTCNGANYTEVCNIMDLIEYKQLMTKQINFLEANFNAAIHQIQKKFSELRNFVSADPRKEFRIEIDRYSVDSLIKSTFEGFNRKQQSNFGQKIGIHDLNEDFSALTNLKTNWSCPSATWSDLEKIRFKTSDEESSPSLSMLNRDSSNNSFQSTPNATPRPRPRAPPRALPRSSLIATPGQQQQRNRQNSYENQQLQAEETEL